MTREPASPPPATPSPARAPLKLSRGMKLVLALLLLVALLGAWFVWTGNRGADDLSQLPPNTPAADPPAEDAASGAPTPEETGSADGVAVPVQPGEQVEVPTIPAFGALEDEAAADPAEALPTPGGINPDTALAALPGVNPFRPLALDSTGETPAPPPAAPVASADTQAADLSGTSGDSSFPDSSDGGALALAPLPGGSGPVTPETVPVPAPPVPGAFPVPALPGADVPAPEVLTVTRPAAPAEPPPVIRVPAPRTSAVQTLAPRRPARPPVAGVSVPRESIDLNGVLARQTPRPGSTSTGTNAAGPDATGPATGPDAAAPTALPTPGTPQPITQLGGDGTPTPANALEALVQSRDLGLNAAVLGPVNTAILHSKGGFLVVSVGQTLPDSQVLVRDVTADSVTLTLGTDTTTLQLDDSANDPTKGEP